MARGGIEALTAWEAILGPASRPTHRAADTNRMNKPMVAQGKQQLAAIVGQDNSESKKSRVPDEQGSCRG